MCRMRLKLSAFRYGNPMKLFLNFPHSLEAKRNLPNLLNWFQERESHIFKNLAPGSGEIFSFPIPGFFGCDLRCVFFTISLWRIKLPPSLPQVRHIVYT